MSRTVKIIIGIVIVLFVTGIIAVCAHHHYAKRSVRDVMYSMQMNRPGMVRGMGRNANPPMMRGIGPGMGQRQMNGMRGGRGPGPMGRMGQGPMRPGRLFNNIPNLTEKQKKDIADLRQKQQDEMKKFRDEMATKVQSMQETNRKKVLDLLTPEQRKLVDSNSGNTNK